MFIKDSLLILAISSILISHTALLSGCQTNESHTAQQDIAIQSCLGASPVWVDKLAPAQSTSQLLVVAVYDKSTAWVSLHEKDADGHWQMTMTTPGFIGKNGLGKTKEGDGKTPRGIFSFNKAFGIAANPGTILPYTQVDDSTYWSGDQRKNMHYNEMVSLKDFPNLDLAESEHIVDYIRHYQYVLNIDYNKDGVVGLGSAIFLHCLGDRKPYTGGCVAIPENQMKVVMQRVRPECSVIIDSLDALGGSF